MSSVSSTSSSSSASSTSSIDTQVQLFTQTVQNTPNATNSQAKSIGVLTENKSELNVQGALQTASDKSDTYSFKVQRAGDSTLNTTLTTNARVQLLNQGGYVVADSGGTPAQQAAYTNWQNGTLDLSSGTYYMKVQRAQSVTQNTVVAYSLTISQGTYSQDYETKAAEAKSTSTTSSNSTTSAATLNNEELASLLSTTLTNNGSGGLTSADIDSNMESSLSNLFSILA